MINFRQRARRARARAKAREARVATAVREMVPCSFGSDHLHPVTLELDADNKVVHVSSPCLLNLPSPEEEAVIRRLLGDKSFQCCAASVAEIRKRLENAQKCEGRRSVLRTDGAEEHVALPELLETLVGRAEARAKEVQEKRANNPRLYTGSELLDRLTFQASMQQARVRGITRGLNPPAEWRLRFRFVDNTGELPRRRLFYGHMQLLISIEEYYEGWEHVATYKGHGRFMLLMNGVRRLADSKRMAPPGNPGGKYACTVCGYAVNNLAQHVRSQRHKDQVERAVLTLCEQIGAKLKHRHWRTR